MLSIYQTFISSCYRLLIAHLDQIHFVSLPPSPFISERRAHMHIHPDITGALFIILLPFSFLTSTIFTHHTSLFRTLQPPGVCRFSWVTVCPTFCTSCHRVVFVRCSCFCMFLADTYDFLFNQSHNWDLTNMAALQGSDRMIPHKQYLI